MKWLSFLSLILSLSLTLFGCARTPPASAPDTGLYLRGEFNNWFSPQDKFEQRSRGLYVTNKTLPPGLYQFMISDKQGSCQATLGKPDQRDPVVSNTVMLLQPCHQSEQWDASRNSVTLLVPESATYHFTLKTDQFPPRLVIIRGQPAG